MSALHISKDLTKNVREACDSQLLKKGSVPISEPDGRHIGLVNIVPSSSGQIPFMSQPMFLDLHLPSTL